MNQKTQSRPNNRTKKQLFDAFVAGEKIDRTLFRPILMHFAARFTGNSYAEFASDHKVLVNSNIQTMEHFDYDMVSLISDPYRETSAFGAPVTYLPEAVPRCEKLIVKSWEDIQNLQHPDVCKCTRTLDRIKGAGLFQKKLQGTVPVIGWIEGPLAEACDLAGVSQMLMQLMMDPDFSNLLLDKCTQTAKDFAKAQIEAGCDVIGIGDAICSQIDPFTYDTFVKERHREIIAFIHENGARTKLHICGDITHILPLLKEVGTDILDLDYDLDISYARSVMGEKTILMGNISPMVIQNSTAEEVERLSRELVAKYGNERFILSAGCEITVGTPHENLVAMRRGCL
ncbi:MAG: uroporphyrinogen decarboxylase family protein [Bacteroidia bacterium]|jgi:MtaA/CmuA family methyltransferase